MKKTIILFFVAIAMISCNTSKQAVTAEMLNGEWKIISVNGQTVKTNENQTAPFLNIDMQKNRVSGSTGCNRLTGGVNVDLDKSSFSFDDKMASTRMMCPDMTVEQSVLEAMQQVQSFNINKKGLLMLTDNEGKVKITLSK